MSNNLATTEPGEPAPAPGKAASKSIWFSWKPNFTGTVSLTTEGSDFDTIMAVYTGTKLTDLKPIASDDDSGGFLTSLVTSQRDGGNDLHDRGGWFPGGVRPRCPRLPGGKWLSNIESFLG